ncbi:hypothetical protein OESDEN_21838 [Oesophagostomum dentatum]|uniref:Uncharacterized protein n=1 Tax=Oesophagostomum dentatum TaxID=61180 RepID=A0A0B1S5N2_OESDE|nr:hypothetical protein OESDEN_21838 [Oesophagostomum dentatum]
MSQDRIKSGEVTFASKERVHGKGPGGGAREGKVQITKIRDSEAGGLPSVKNEDFFHGFMPREQVRLVVFSSIIATIITRSGRYVHLTTN